MSLSVVINTCWDHQTSYTRRLRQSSRSLRVCGLTHRCSRVVEITQQSSACRLRFLRKFISCVLFHRLLLPIRQYTTVTHCTEMRLLLSSRRCWNCVMCRLRSRCTVLLLLLLLLLLKCTYLIDTVTRNAAGALYTINKIPAYNI